LHAKCYEIQDVLRKNRENFRVASTVHGLLIRLAKDYNNEANGHTPAGTARLPKSKRTSTHGVGKELDENERRIAAHVIKVLQTHIPAIRSCADARGENSHCSIFTLHLCQGPNSDV